MKFIVKPANIIECNLRKSGNFGEYVRYIAKEKAAMVAKDFNDNIIIAADTIVVFDNEIVGKPRDFKDACSTLIHLSDNWHRVYTGVFIKIPAKNRNYSFYELTRVKFRKLYKKEIIDYVNSGSPMDKAGSYGIQDDYGCTFVEKIVGDYFNVVGLPVLKTYLCLREVLNKSI